MKRVGELIPYTPHGFSNDSSSEITQRLKKHKSDPGKLNINDKLEDKNLLKMIFYILLHQQDEPSLPLVCRHWKEITDSLLELRPSFHRSQALEILLGTFDEKTCLSDGQKQTVEKYHSLLEITPYLTYEFFKNWFYQQISDNNFKLSKATLLNQAYAIAKENPPNFICICSSDKISHQVPHAPVLFLVKKGKFEAAFAFAEAMDILHSKLDAGMYIKVSEKLMEILINKKGYEPTLRMIGEMTRSDYFFKVFMEVGSRHIIIRKKETLRAIISLEKDLFICSVLNYFIPKHSVCILPDEAANILISKLIIPLCNQDPYKLSIDIARERLINALFDIIPENFNFSSDINEIHRKLFSFYYQSVVFDEIIPYAFGKRMSQKEADIFIDRINLVPHIGLRKCIFSKIFQGFYAFKPDMIDWWPMIEHIEDGTDLETHAAQQLTRYLIKKRKFVDVLNNPGENLKTFPSKFVKLLEENPGFLTTFEHVNKDIKTQLPDEKVMVDHSEESFVNDSSQDKSEESSGELSEISYSSDESIIQCSEEEIFNIYEDVINFLIGIDRVMLAKSVICLIMPQTLKDNIQRRFKGL